MPPLAVGGLRGVGLDMGLLEAPAASLPRLTSLVARSARLSAAMDTGKKDTFLPEEAALAGLPASPSFVLSGPRIAGGAAASSS